MTGPEFHRLLADLRSALATLADGVEHLSPHQGRKLRADLHAIAEEVRQRVEHIDPIKQPEAFFDPADPKLFGTFAALALMGQTRLPLSSIRENRFYGSGVYALYYRGPFEMYAPISGTEHPIYVGTAAAAEPIARTPLEQGDRLWNRLNFHRKNITRASGTLDVSDFEFRALVVATGFELQAETALINLFQPAWNWETKILFGFGKHGDSAKKRSNDRSPWDVVHSGRAWAHAEELQDAKTPEQIRDELLRHWAENAPIRSLEEVLRQLLSRIKRRP